MLFVHWATSVLKAMLLANLVMYPVMAATGRQRRVKIVQLITSLRGQGRLALFALMEHSRLREIPPVHPVILRAQPATKLRPHA